MKTIYLLSCTRTKRKCLLKLPARKLYSSAWFKDILDYCEKQNPDGIYVISAKHHLVPLDKKLHYYDVCLDNFSEEENKLWADKVLEDLAKIADLNNDKFIIFASSKYRRNLITRMKNYEIPIEDFSEENRNEWIRKNIKNEEK